MGGQSLIIWTNAIIISSSERSKRNKTINLSLNPCPVMLTLYINIHDQSIKSNPNKSACNQTLDISEGNSHEEQNIFLFEDVKCSSEDVKLFYFWNIPAVHAARFDLTISSTLCKSKIQHFHQVTLHSINFFKSIKCHKNE